MNEKLLIGLFTGSGALLYNFWGFFNAWKEAQENMREEHFDWRRTIVTVVPSVVAGFLAGYAMNPDTVGDYVALITSGFGVAAAQGKAKFESFFKLK